MYWSSLPLKQCLFALALVQTVAADTSDRASGLQFRQSTATATPVTCLDYSSIANLSTIGHNATMRAAYLQAAPDGTDHSVAILNDAELKLPALTKNVELNDQCGNLTTIALEEAANNFTKGIVAQYRVPGSAGTRNQGVLGAVLVGFGVTVGTLLVM